MFIDSHAHLSELSADEFSHVLQKADSAKVSAVLNVGTNISTSMAALMQSCSSSAVRVFTSVGICPPEIGTADAGWEESLKELVQKPGVVAVGEIGIDGINESYPPMDIQRPFYCKQLEIARDADLPALIHARGAESEALKICLDLKVKKALFHCFTGTAEEAAAIADAGYYISFSGIITFKNSDFDEIVRAVPEEQILFETDSPYLAPVPYRGKINEPAFVSHVYEYAATVRNVPVKELAARCNNSFSKLFSI